MRLIVLPFAYWTPRVLLYRWTDHDSFLYVILPLLSVAAAAFLAEQLWRSRLPAIAWGGIATCAILATSPAFLLLRDNTLGDPFARLYFRQRVSFVVHSLGFTDAPFFLGLLLAGILVWLVIKFTRDHERRMNHGFHGSHG